MGSNKKTPASAQIATALAYGNTQCSRRWQLAIAATGCVGCTTSPRRSIRQPRSTCGYRRRNAMPYKLSSGRRYLYGELLPGEMIETRLKDCSQDWISACQSAIAAAPEEFVDDLLSAISLAVRVERNRRANAPMPETERRQRSLFSSGLTWIPTGHTQRTWSNSGHQSGGGGEIRTHGRVAPSLVFKTSALNRSATPPGSAHFITASLPIAPHTACTTCDETRR